MSTFTNNKPDQMARSHKPYRPTYLSGPRRDRCSIGLGVLIGIVVFLLIATNWHWNYSLPVNQDQSHGK